MKSGTAQEPENHFVLCLNQSVTTLYDSVASFLPPHPKITLFSSNTNIMEYTILQLKMSNFIDSD